MASWGVYDSATNVVFVTRQRGRLLFHMGVRAKDNDGVATTLKKLHSTGWLSQFTGQLLYPEEASFLMQRDALHVQVADGLASPRRQPHQQQQTEKQQQQVKVSLGRFLSLVAQHPESPDTECMAVFRFLKAARLLPRRHWDRDRAIFVVPRVLPTTEVIKCQTQSQGNAPFAFDVWRKRRKNKASVLPKRQVSQEQSSSGTDLQLQHQQQQQSLRTIAQSSKAVEHLGSPAAGAGAGAGAGATSTSNPSLELLFRVVVCRFEYPMPSPERLRCIKQQSAEAIPVQVAVVDREQSVLLFGIH